MTEWLRDLGDIARPSMMSRLSMDPACCPQCEADLDPSNGWACPNRVNHDRTFYDVILHSRFCAAVLTSGEQPCDCGTP